MPRNDPSSGMPAPQSASGQLGGFALGLVRPLDHPDFERGANQSDQSEPEPPYAAPEPARAGIYFLEPYAPGRVPVLFVHGIGGTPRDLRPLIASLDRARFQAWVFLYPTDLRLASAARLLHEVLTELRRAYPFDALLITAHSMGGLVSRAYATGDDGYLRAIVTFDTPWEGHPWAAVGARFAIAPSPVWFDLSPGSEFLLSLRRPLSRGGRRIPHYVFFGFRRDVGFLIPESSDGVISIASQLPLWLQAEAAHCWGYDASHVGILGDAAALARYSEILKDEADHLDASASQTSHR